MDTLVLHLDVKQEDIDKGIPCNSEYCPIAQALRRHGYNVVSVDGDEIAIDDYYLGNVPAEIDLFIDRFDSLETRPEATPFEINLEFVRRFYPEDDEDE